MKTIVTLACLAWSGVAISTASAARAGAITTQVGDFAACANTYVTSPQNHCGYQFEGEIYYEWYTPYKQQIKFNQTACGSGGCNSDTSDVFVTNAYSQGRRDVTSAGLACSDGLGTKMYYELAPCAC